MGPWLQFFSRPGSALPPLALNTRALHQLAFEGPPPTRLLSYPGQSQALVIARSSREIQEVKKTLDVSGETFCVVINRSDEVVGILTLKELIGSWPMNLANDGNR